MTQICVTGKQNFFDKIQRKKVDIKICQKTQLLRYFENHKNLKIRKSGQNWHFYLLIEQPITFKIVRNSLSRRIFKSATIDFRFLAKVVIFKKIQVLWSPKFMPCKMAAFFLLKDLGYACLRHGFTISMCQLTEISRRKSIHRTHVSFFCWVNLWTAWFLAVISQWCI